MSDTEQTCEHCKGPIGEATPVWYHGDPYHRRCAFKGYCELCGVEIENDINLSPIEYNGVTVKACPGCHGAAGGVA